MLDKIPIYFVVHVQALQEEQAEEMKAKELEKQLAMMELDPNHLIAYVATQHPLYVSTGASLCRPPQPPPPLFHPPSEEAVPPSHAVRTSKPILPYSSMFFLSSDNR